MDVIRSNFEDVFPQIEKALRQCDFVAIDTEFTGLAAQEHQRPSLFDTPSERYKKLRKTVNQFLVCQFGVSAFVKSTEYSNKYEAHTFNFHLFPSSFGQIDVRFLSQASSLEFLCHHKLDFNKFVYEGVPFLNTSQKAELKRLCSSNEVRVPVTLNREIEETFILPQCKKIEEWLKEEKNNNLVLQCDGAFLQFLLYQDIQKKFSHLECEIGGKGELLLMRQVNEKPSKDDKEQIEKIICQACGFTRVFDLLVELKKPLLGHNLLTDILFLYEKFNNFLPDDYYVFKKEIHELFPYVFDTKHIALVLDKHEFFRETDLFKKTNLEVLYSELSCHKGLYYVLYTPGIVHAKYCDKYIKSHSFHEAGFDAYISGYVFLRMVHIFAAKIMGPTMERPLDFGQYFNMIKNHGNYLNISRATVPYVNLAGDDPMTTRPTWLHISRKLSLKPLITAEIVDELGQFGSLDVKMLDRRRALVATIHQKVSQRIVKSLRRHKTLRVREYHPLFDSPRSRTLMWAGGLTTVITLLFGGLTAIYCGRKKIK